MHVLRATRLLLPVLTAAACAAPRTLDDAGRGPVAESTARALALRGPQGLEHVEANWKERLAQPYVFLEQRGDYRRIGETMTRLLGAAESLDLEQDGAPFVLFFDDPGRVPVDELRARACLAVPERPARLGELQYDLLPRAMVVYARVSGTHPEVARSYPALFSYLRELGWQPGGPVREVYLVHPLDAAGREEILTEVQIPWAARAE